jgi:hypothetical protein
MGGSTSSLFSSVRLPTMNNVKRLGSAITLNPAQKMAAAVGTAIVSSKIKSIVMPKKPSFLNRIKNKFRSKPKKTNSRNIEMTNVSTLTKINESEQQLQQQQTSQQEGGNKQTPSKKEKTPSKKEKTPSKKEKTPSKKEKTPSKKEKKTSKKEKKTSKK